MARAVAIFRENTLERAKLEAEPRSARGGSHHGAPGRARNADRRFQAGNLGDDRGPVRDGRRPRPHGKWSSKALPRAPTTRLRSSRPHPDQASANVGTVAAGNEQLSASISEIGSQISVALSNVNDTSSMTITTNERMSELLASAQEIGQVVTLIREIAGQTSLLALNATIEAARAPARRARGFAVVATEVKTLATRTAQATESISKAGRLGPDRDRRSRARHQRNRGSREPRQRHRLRSQQP